MGVTVWKRDMTSVFYIEIIPAEGERRQIPIGDSLLVGRSPRQCDVVIHDPRVSRIHLRVSPHPETGITITDLYSANGSTLDGRRLPPGMPFHWLLGQALRIGSTRLMLAYGEMDW